MASFIGSLLFGGWSRLVGSKRLRDESEADEEDAIRATVAKARRDQLADAFISLRERARKAEARVSELELILDLAGPSAPVAICQ